MKKQYSDEQVNEFLELAQEVGITRAKRELGYPNSWGTAQYWAKQRNVALPQVNDLQAKAAAVREWYKDEDLKLVAQEGLDYIYNELVTNKELSADEQKKLAEAYQKYVNTLRVIDEKSTNIVENRTTDTFDERIQAIINEEQTRKDGNVKQ